MAKEMPKKLLTQKQRGMILEFSALLNQLGRPKEAYHLDTSSALIPEAKSKDGYIAELMALLDLRRECYAFAGENEMLRAFLKGQADLQICGNVRIS